MSNVRDKEKKNKSKAAFDDTYFRIHDDALLIIKNNFGAKELYEPSFMDLVLSV